MTPKLTQHRIRSFGEILDYLRSGSRTVLESVEFDLSVGRGKNNEPVLEIGHPIELRHRTIPTTSAQEFFARISRVVTKQLIIDVKAKNWLPEKGRSEFTQEEMEQVFKELPGLIAQYRKEMENSPIHSEIVVASVNEEFFREARARDVNFGEGVKTCFFGKYGESIEQYFEKAEELGVDRLNISFRDGFSQEELQKAAELSQNPEYQKLEISFSGINETGHIEAVKELFPGAEIITDKSQEFEKEFGERKKIY